MSIKPHIALRNKACLKGIWCRTIPSEGQGYWEKKQPIPFQELGHYLEDGPPFSKWLAKGVISHLYLVPLLGGLTKPWLLTTYEAGQSLHVGDRFHKTIRLPQTIKTSNHQKVISKVPCKRIVSYFCP